jgi:hypothetical protein
MIVVSCGYFLYYKVDLKYQVAIFGFKNLSTVCVCVCVCVCYSEGKSIYLSS